MENVDITKNLYGERVKKSPPFAKDVFVVLSDDVSVETMKRFNSGKDWMDPMIKEVVLDWNLMDGDKKLPISLEGLDKIRSIKLRNWIIGTINETVVESLSLLKKK